MARVQHQRGMKFQELQAPVIFTLACGKQVFFFLVNMEECLPLCPLRLASGNLGIKFLGNMSHGDAVEGLGDEFALFPKHLLKLFDLRQKLDNMPAHPLDQAHHLKPAFG